MRGSSMTGPNSDPPEYEGRSQPGPTRDPAPNPAAQRIYSTPRRSPADRMEIRSGVKFGSGTLVQHRDDVSFGALMFVPPSRRAHDVVEAAGVRWLRRWSFVPRAEDDAWLPHRRSRPMLGGDTARHPEPPSQRCGGMWHDDAPSVRLGSAQGVAGPNPWGGKAARCAFAGAEQPEPRSRVRQFVLRHVGIAVAHGGGRRQRPGGRGRFGACHDRPRDPTCGAPRAGRRAVLGEGGRRLGDVLRGGAGDIGG